MDLCKADQIYQTQMKAKHAICLVVVTAMMAGALVLSRANTPNLMGDNEPILIHQNSSDPIGGPRMPAYNPFYAELEGNYVFLGSVNGVGTVHVELYSTAGDDYSVFFDTSTGSIYIPISGNSGYYTLLITVTDDLQFIGEFII